MLEHEVALEHLKVGDEVVWLPQGNQNVPLHTLDIGKVVRTIYSVNQQNQGYLLATVDFQDRIEGTTEVISHNGHRVFRRLVHVEHLKRLGDFLESVNSTPPNLLDSNNNGRSYVVRACMLKTKLQATHPVIMELDPIFSIRSKIVVKGSVKRILKNDNGSLFIGAEFESPVYTRELQHSDSCGFVTNNGCEKRIAININNLTKMIWETEFKLIIHNTKEATFEDLFYRDEPPPSYNSATSKFLAPVIFPQSPVPPSPQIYQSPLSPYYPPQPPSYFSYPSITPTPIPTAPPLTYFPTSPKTLKSPALYPTSSLVQMQNPLARPTSNNNMQSWEQFNNDTLPHLQQSNQASLNSTPVIISKDHSSSMMNLNEMSHFSEAIQSPKPKITEKPNQKSLLVSELKSKLKIQPQEENQLSDSKPSSSQKVNYISEIDVQPQISPLNSNPKHRVLVNELEQKLRKNDEKGSVQFKDIRPQPVPPTIKEGYISDKKELNKPANPLQHKPFTQLSTPSITQTQKPRIIPLLPGSANETISKRSDTSSVNNTGIGLSRSTSCLSINSRETRNLPPKPFLAPKPIKTPKPELSAPVTFTTTQKDTVSIVNKLKPEATSKFSFPPSMPQKEVVTPTKHVKLPPLPPRPISLPPETTTLKTNQINTSNNIDTETANSSFLYSQVLPIKTEFPNPPPFPVSNTKIIETFNLETHEIPPRPHNRKPSNPQTVNNTSKDHIKEEEQNENQSRQDHSEILDDTIAEENADIVESEEPQKSNRISRINLPPPPPPPMQPLKDGKEHSDFPPPPTDWLNTNSNGEMHNPEVSSRASFDNDRGGLLQQIHKGIKLRPVSDDINSDKASVNSGGNPVNNNDGGFESILKGAIKTRRTMMDDDEDDSDEYDDDDDSDAWD